MNIIYNQLFNGQGFDNEWVRLTLQQQMSIAVTNIKLSKTPKLLHTSNIARNDTEMPLFQIKYFFYISLVLFFSNILF